ncbi:hypothetical protein BT96DRAFT_503636 [Gymnopus androsaceus JB14]|uniref:Uncharacterized protein n=1 Tax=Gymnopus androsaceus JB14 TaxID=1447944 RepID=A0A6A4I1H9_9AGAR|nr:hypothetical protein BT96DRAFT_503636 [Gymnopus androsaceus JB14]
MQCKASGVWVWVMDAASDLRVLSPTTSTNQPLQTPDSEWSSLTPSMPPQVWSRMEASASQVRIQLSTPRTHLPTYLNILHRSLDWIDSFFRFHFCWYPVYIPLMSNPHRRRRRLPSSVFMSHRILRSTESNADNDIIRK